MDKSELEQQHFKPRKLAFTIMESKPTSNIVAIAPLVVNVVRSFKVLSTALQSKPASEVVGNTPDRTRNVGRYQLLIAHAVKVDEELGRFRVCLPS